jgi:hypothetical protein
MTTAVPLENLAQRIARQQAELEALRQEYEARQNRLADLKRRREELERQLRQLDAEIQTVDQGETPPKAAGGKAAPAKANAAAAPAKAVRPNTLPALLVNLVRRANGPLTMKQLADAVVHRKYPTTSQNIPGLIQTRVRELVAKGILQPSPDKPGFVLARPGSEAKVPVAKPALRKSEGQKSAESSTKTPPKNWGGRPEKPLRVVLTEILAKSPGPLPARELAKQAKAQGYRSESKDFVQVIWVVLNKMDNVENVPGKGYRLKKR